MPASPGAMPAWPDLRATAAAFAAVVASFYVVVASAEIAPRYRPADGERTLLVLPAALARPAQAAGPESAVLQAEEFLQLARTTGDTRYLGRAEAAIRPWSNESQKLPRIDLVAAHLAQQRHELSGARRLLGRVLDAEPRNTNALLMRANVGILAGDFAAARRDCLGVLQAGDMMPGTICLSATMTGPGSLERARRLVASLGAAGNAPPAVVHWRLLTEADLALRAGDDRSAIALLEQARALDAGSEETRTRLAELLLAQGQADRALAIAHEPNASLARLVVRLRAADALGDTLAASSRRQVDALIEAAGRRGANRPYREEALIALHADRDAARALALARLNFERQKDTADIRLLVDAALAAGDRETLRAAREWLVTTGFEDHVVDARLREAGA